MVDPNFSICVYCGSRSGENPLFAEIARAVGDWIGTHGGQLVYGGGRSGLMGIVADATQAAGGRVVGVIPQTLVDKEHARTACDELHIVQTMHERKAMMAERSDAFWRCRTALVLLKNCLKSGRGASWATTTSRLA